MKVKELLEHLNKQDPESEVFMSTDAKGNAYHGIYQVFESDYKGKVILFADDVYHTEDEFYKR